MKRLSNAEKRRARIRLLADLVGNESGKPTDESRRRCFRAARELVDLFKAELAFLTNDSSALRTLPPRYPEQPRKSAQTPHRSQAGG